MAMAPPIPGSPEALALIARRVRIHTVGAVTGTVAIALALASLTASMLAQVNIIPDLLRTQTIWIISGVVTVLIAINITATIRSSRFPRPTLPPKNTDDLADQTILAATSDRSLYIAYARVARWVGIVGLIVGTLLVATIGSALTHNIAVTNVPMFAALIVILLPVLAVYIGAAIAREIAMRRMFKFQGMLEQVLAKAHDGTEGATE